jgi:hypothetical protein
VSYNGWTNWETWNVALWVDNDEGLYREKMRYFNRHACDSYNVQWFISEFFPDGTPDMDSPKEMRAVDYEEIAANWASEFEEEEETAE